MTRIHFAALADAFRAARPNDYPAPSPAHAMWCMCVQNVADTCGRFNPDFDRARFLAAVGLIDD